MSFFYFDPPLRLVIENPHYVHIESKREVPALVENLTEIYSYWGENTQLWHYFGLPTENGGNAWWKPAGDVILNFKQDDWFEITYMDLITGLEHFFIDPRRGDLNLDGQVTISDFIDLTSNFNAPGDWMDGDLNGDGQVSISDFIDLASNMASAGVIVTPVFTPEPAVLFIGAMWLLAACRRNK